MCRKRIIVCFERIICDFCLISLLLLSCNKQGKSTVTSTANSSSENYSYYTIISGYEAIFDSDGCIVIYKNDSIGRYKASFAKMDNIPGEYQHIKNKVVSVFCNDNKESIISYHSGLIIEHENLFFYDDNLNFYCYKNNLSTSTTNNCISNSGLLQAIVKTQDIASNVSSLQIVGWDYIIQSINRIDLQQKSVINIDTITDPDIHRRLNYFITVSKKMEDFYNLQIEPHL